MHDTVSYFQCHTYPHVSDNDAEEDEEIKEHNESTLVVHLLCFVFWVKDVVVTNVANHHCPSSTDGTGDGVMCILGNRKIMILLI